MTAALATGMTNEDAARTFARRDVGLRATSYESRRSRLLGWFACGLAAATFAGGAACTHAPEDANEALDVAALTSSRTVELDFSRNQGDLGFKGLFRDVPARQHAEYVRRVENGLDLGPVPPETITQLGSPDEDSHWFMNAGVHAVPDHPGLFGYLLQGVNRSDDMDKYMVREFGAADGLRPLTRYEIAINEATFAANDRLGAFGPGGGEARTFDAYVVNKDPYPFIVDFNEHVRFTDDNVPSIEPGRISGIGGTGVCVLSGSGIPPLPGIPPCPNGRVPYAIEKSANPKPLSITTDDRGRFWLMIGGHSGHEGLDEYFIIKLGLKINGEFVGGSP